ncbi:hypothetical protein [Paraburkholderia sacchari]|uniref:hypothetical protein n=1 Tax=Paraburkholderia sacchari TaxID=159450 RepID=UPI001BCEB877|nr:hypothetical protein [Paraburkholderia sacchari]
MDNSESESLLLPESEKAEDPDGDPDVIALPGAEQALLGVMARFERFESDPATDRLHVLTWVGKGLTPDELAEAYRRAIARREQRRDDRPVGVKFLDRLVGDVLAEHDQPERGARDSPWWESDSGIGAQGKRVHVARRPNESTPEYLVRVTKASGKGPWIEFVLKQWQGTSRYQQVIEFLGEDLLPVDFYAS